METPWEKNCKSYLCRDVGVSPVVGRPVIRHTCVSTLCFDSHLSVVRKYKTYGDSSSFPRVPDNGQTLKDLYNVCKYLVLNGDLRTLTLMLLDHWTEGWPR